MINCCVNNNMVPKIFKISRISPINKPEKPIDEISSYRAINNLPTLEKILEAHVLNNLNKYLIENNIILPNHHGGRKGHSTTTALLQINNTLNINYEKGLISVALATDLTAAFETIDHEILLKKLNHYGICNKENYFF